MNKQFIKKRIIFTFISLFFIIFHSKVAKFKAEVSNRELLIFANIAYYNNLEDENLEIALEKKYAAENLEAKRSFAPYEMGGWRIIDKDINISNKSKGGFSAIVFKKENDIVISFRGSDGGVWSENYKYLIPIHRHPQTVYLKNFIQNVANSNYINKNTKIYTTGHSLGGYLSLYSAGVILQNEKLCALLQKTVSFCGFGLGRIADREIINVLRSSKFRNIENYHVKGDIISYFGEFITKPIILKFINIQTSKNKNPRSIYSLKLAKAHQIAQLFCHDIFKLEPLQ